MDDTRPRMEYKNISIYDLQRAMLIFTLSLYNNPLLCRAAVQQIIEDFDNFISNIFIPFLQCENEKYLKPLATPVVYSKVQFILEDRKKLFSYLSTEHARFKIYEKECHFVRPQLFEIGEENVIDDNEGVKPKKVQAVHVPLADSLRNLLEKPGVFQQIMNYVHELEKDKETLRNVMQGSLWILKYLPLFLYRIVLPLILYYDDFEVGNALGSHAGEQKLGGCYVSCPFLPPHLVAKMSNIFISTICYSKHLKQFGNQMLFVKSIQDLNNLSRNGITVNVGGQNVQVYFQCVAVSGDNAGLNTTCGFSESFSAKYWCRICTASSDECKELVEEMSSLVRTVESYETELKNGCKNSSIKENCVFNQIDNFHIAENMSLDFMHDVSEGVAVYTVRNIIDALIKDKIITLSVVNSKIERFPYGDVESSKPRPLYYAVSKKGDQIKLKCNQSASEMLCLTRYLGLMIGDLIDPGNEYWKLYLLLREIIGILTLPNLRKSDCWKLQELIRKHNALYLKLFGHLKPKMHMWLHCLRIMLLTGPPIKTSSEMFERKNKKLKEIGVNTTSNINLPYTISIKHQLQLAYHSITSVIPSSDLILGPVKNKTASSAFRKIVPNFDSNMNVKTLKFIKILGKMFRSGTVFVCEISVNNNIQFAMIDDIYSCENGQTFVCATEFKVSHFDHYYHAYNVILGFEKRLINVDSLLRTPPCLLVTLNGESYIALRYDV